MDKQGFIFGIEVGIGRVGFSYDCLVYRTVS